MRRIFAVLLFLILLLTVTRPSLAERTEKAEGELILLEKSAELLEYYYEYPEMVISAESKKGERLLFLIGEYHAAGREERVEELIEKFSSQCEQEFLFELYLEGHLLDKGYEFIVEMEDESGASPLTVTGRGKLAEKYIAAGRDDRAEDLLTEAEKKISEIKHEAGRDYSRKKLASRFFTADQVEQAEKLAEKIAVESLRKETFKCLVELCLQEGEIERAREYIDEWELDYDLENKYTLYEESIEAMLEVNSNRLPLVLEKYRDILREEEDSQLRLEKKIELAPAYVTAGDREAAMEILDSVREELSYEEEVSEENLLTLVETYIEIGEMGAIKHLPLDALKNISGRWNYRFRNIIEDLLVEGEEDVLRELIEQIESNLLDDGAPVSSLLLAAGVYDTVGSNDKKKRVEGRIKDIVTDFISDPDSFEYRRRDVGLDYLDEILQLGMKDLALTIVNKALPYYRENGSREEYQRIREDVIESYLKEGLENEADKLVSEVLQEVEDLEVSVRFHLLRGVMDACYRAGEDEKALQVASREDTGFLEKYHASESGSRKVRKLLAEGSYREALKRIVDISPIDERISFLFTIYRQLKEEGDDLPSGSEEILKNIDAGTVNPLESFIFSEIIVGDYPDTLVFRCEDDFNEDDVSDLALSDIRYWEAEGGVWLVYYRRGEKYYPVRVDFFNPEKQVYRLTVGDLLKGETEWKKGL
ncbi:MAG: tetratricopeptide repeat protein [Halanaerobiales bacterium]